MTTDAGDAGRMTAEQIEYYRDLATNAKLGAANPINAAEVRQLIHHIDAQSAQLTTYQSATGFLVRQGLCFITRYNAVECIACGEQAGTQEAIRHMPDCAAEALRALVAGDGEGT